MGEAYSPGNGVSFMGLSKRQAITAAALLVALLLCSISLVPAARSAFHSRPASQSRARRLEVPKHTTHALNQLPSRYGSPQGFQRKLTRADLLIAIPAEVSRLPLVASSRGWRRGVPTFITIDQPVTPELIASQPIMKEGMDLYNETYGFSENSGVGLHHKAGDRRATLTPFIANHSMGLDTFKWLLFGDDDTIYFIENTLNMLETMDHTVPYILSDHIWYPHWPAGSTEHHLHANRLAPRCLPCGYNDPLAPSYQHVPYQFDSQPECFCDHYALCRGDQHGLFDHGDCHWTSYGPGFWYFPHGGAGMIFSWDLFRGNTLEGVTGWVNGRWDISSGDSMICALIRDNFWILPTDPGYGYYRPNIRLFDPGWKGPQMKGPEDETVLAEDNGNDPLGLVYRLQTAIVDGSCHDECEDQLQHVLTTHLRTRYMTHEVDMGEVEIAVGKHNGTGEDHRIAMYLHHKMTRLMNQYDSMRQGRTWFNELSRNQTGTF